MQNFDHNIGFWKKRQFFAKNCQKLQKIVIITLTPGWPDEFVIKSPQMQSNPFFAQNNTFRVEKIAPKMYATSASNVQKTQN
jgi:hypothetical protein